MIPCLGGCISVQMHTFESRGCTSVVASAFAARFDMLLDFALVLAKIVFAAIDDAVLFSCTLN